MIPVGVDLDVLTFGKKSFFGGKKSIFKTFCQTFRCKIL